MEHGLQLIHGSAVKIQGVRDAKYFADKYIILRIEIHSCMISFVFQH